MKLARDEGTAGRDGVAPEVVPDDAPPEAPQELKHKRRAALVMSAAAAVEAIAGIASAAKG